MGKSGAGKSTLLHVLACIDSYEGGEYYLNDVLIKDLSEKRLAQIRNENIGMVMQDFALVEDFTASENVIIPLSFAKNKVKDKKERLSPHCRKWAFLTLSVKMLTSYPAGKSNVSP